MSVDIGLRKNKIPKNFLEIFFIKRTGSNKLCVLNMIEPSNPSMQCQFCFDEPSTSSSSLVTCIRILSMAPGTN